MIEGTVDIFQAFLDSRLNSLHTCVPGRIESYSSSERKAKVKPLVKLAVKDDQDVSNIDIPPIENVPVMFPSAGEFSLLYPLKKGDGCLIIFAEVGIGNYLNSTENKAVDADDLSRFSLTDAICIPGLFPFKLIPNGNNTIEITDSGNIEIKAANNIILNGGTSSAIEFEELKAQFDAFVLAFNTHTHVYSPGPSTPVSTATPLPQTLADIANAEAGTVKL